MNGEGPVRLAVVLDYPEEGWASMDLVGEMILSHLTMGHAARVSPTMVCPPFRRRFSRWSPPGLGKAARNGDRFLNRLVDYPRALRRVARRGKYDLFHIVDHSYSQLVHALPQGRAVITCHDLDTFRCVLEPERDPRPAWFRLMAGRILRGFRRAAAVACNSAATRDELLTHRLFPAGRLHVVPLGTHPECSPDPDRAADAEAARLLGTAGPVAGADLLHVGSNIPRKRIDVLLAVFSDVRRVRPDARLVKAGGPLSAGQRRQARELGVEDAVLTLPMPLSRTVLAAVYRRASLVLLPSESEGFGLPAAEALACGAPLLASDIPALREVAGGAAVYGAVGDVAGWTEAALRLLNEPLDSPEASRARRDAGLERARLYSWSAHADRLVEIYRAVLDRPFDR